MNFKSFLKKYEFYIMLFPLIIFIGFIITTYPVTDDQNNKYLFARNLSFGILTKQLHSQYIDEPFGNSEAELYIKSEISRYNKEHNFEIKKYFLSLNKDNSVDITLITNYPYWGETKIASSIAMIPENSSTRKNAESKNWSDEMIFLSIISTIVVIGIASFYRLGEREKFL